MNIYVTIGNFTALFPVEALEECYHQGPCDEDCEIWSNMIDWQKVGVNHQEMIEVLMEYGAWERKELQDSLTLTRQRFLWIAAGDFHENLPEQYLLVENCQEGIVQIMPIGEREHLDIEKVVKKWIKAEFRGEMELDQGIWVEPCAYYAQIKTDKALPSDVRCWNSGGFYLKCLI